jgi:acyl-CoA synthetase (NDP forming)
MAQALTNSFFEHQSVAIVGVSGSYNIGQAYVDSLVRSGFKGKIYPVNQNGGEVSGLKVYRSVTEIPGDLDYVISCIPASFSRQLVEQSAAKHAKVLSFFTAGFSESGREDGRQLEEDLLQIARETGIRLLGPNCLGLYCPGIGLSFAADFPQEAGRVAFIGQSGGNSMYLIRVAGQRGIRFSKAVSYGNAVDVDESDLMDYFADDQNTAVVAAYFEGVRDGHRFQRSLTRLAGRKPVVVLKGGHTEAGAGAAASHTGSLAGSEEAWDALLKQTGAVQVRDLEEMADMLATFSYMDAPAGNNLVVCGANGGFSVLTADEFVGAGFKMPAPDHQSRQQIREVIGRFSSTDAGMMLTNPFDITNIPSGEGLYAVMKELANDSSFDLMVLQVSISNSGWPHGDSPFRIWPHTFLDAALRVLRGKRKPMAVIIHGTVTTMDFQIALDLRRKCYEAGLPVYDSISRAALALGRFRQYHSGRSPRLAPVVNRPRPL